MTRRFAHSAQQRMYDAMLIHGSADRVIPGGGTAAAFYRGYHGILTQANTYGRTTLAYAAWAAGVDRRRAEQPNV